MIGLLVGYIAGRRRGPRPLAPPKPVPARCGCKHDLAMHDPNTNQCHGLNRQKLWGPQGQDYGYGNVQCTCRQYNGPRPIDQVFAPQILPPAGT
jgi:hypothetical protein